MEEYKGIYYGDNTEQKFYEGGAHFKYIELYKRLEIIFKQQQSKDKLNPKTRNSKSTQQSKTGNTSIYKNNNNSKENNFFISKFFLGNKNLKPKNLDSSRTQKKDVSISHTNNNNNNYLKKPLSVTRNKNNSSKINQLSHKSISNYNYIYSKRNRQVSLEPNNIVNKTTYNNNKDSKKSLKFVSNLGDNTDRSNNKKNNKNNNIKDLTRNIDAIKQSNTQRNYCIKVKKYNISSGNLINLIYYYHYLIFDLYVYYFYFYFDYD